MKLARDMLDEERIILSGPNGVKHLCLAQRHMHKKGIMFTTFIFALTIADILGIEFLWSSDSDTLVFEDTLERSISTIAGDPTVGGSSTGLTVHNGDETVVTSLAATVYWAELYLTRSSPACTATSDCQSGPCTAFRLSSMPSILMPWYMQRVFGKRMVCQQMFARLPKSRANGNRTSRSSMRIAISLAIFLSAVGVLSLLLTCSQPRRRPQLPRAGYDNRFAGPEPLTSSRS